jgi:DNA-binding NtrC family response regulator
MNGFEASQAIMTEDRQAIIVMVTGLPDSGLARSALEKGFVRVAIPKPFQLDQLKIAVEEALKKAEPQRAAPAKEGVVA